MKKRQIIDLIIIFLLGLTPLLWFQGNQIILGHDAGLTLSPMPHFFDRLFAWTERFGFGSDQTYAIPGFFIHGLEALVAYLGFNLQAVQKIVFVFWFLLPGLTMYYFSSRLSKRLQMEYFALPASALYMFNHFLLQGWFVAERTKFSVYAALPLVMAFLFDWEDKKRSTFNTALIISLLLFVLNGEASLPLFGGLLLTVTVFIFFYSLKGITWLKIKQLAQLSIISLGLSILLNAYWLLPYGAFVRKSYSSQISQAGGLGGVLNWIDYVSRYSSLSNMFRLQGIPEWYLNNLHPYASPFLNNPFLIAISFLFAVGALVPLYLIKDQQKREKILFFSFLTFLTMIFMAGSHRPFGAFYVFLVNFVPGFIAFRNPFYKFAPALWFSYAILIGFTVNYLLNRIQIGEMLGRIRLNRSLLVNFLYFMVPLIIVLYSFPFLNGSFFDYIRGVRSTRVIVPEYVLEFGNWSDSPERLNTKVLPLPPPNSDNRVDAYTWGYWSLSPLSTLLTNAPIINQTSYMPPSETILVGKLYKMMRENDPGWKNLAGTLGIQSFLLRKDFDWKTKWSPTDNPAIYKKLLENSGLTLTKSFGEWEIYDFKDTTKGYINLSNTINYLDGTIEDLEKIASIPNYNPKDVVYISTTASEKPAEILKIVDKTFLVPNCIACNLQHKFVNLGLYIPLITRDSLLYPIIKFKNRLAEAKASTNSEKVNYYLYQSLVSILAFDKFVAQEKDPGLILDSVIDYGYSLDALNSSLAKYLDKETINNDFFWEISDVLRTQKIIILRNSEEISHSEVTSLLNDKYKYLEEIHKTVDANIWKTTDEVNKKFLVNSNLNSEFDIFYNPKMSNFQQPSEVNFVLDDKTYKVKPAFISNDWLSLGKITLSKGKHRLIIEYPLENLYIGSSSAQLTSLGTFSCFLSNTIIGERNDIFRASFEHKRLAGSKKFFTKIIQEDIHLNPLDRAANVLDSTSVWDLYTVDYTLNNDGKFHLTVCSSLAADKANFNSTIELRNINIRKLAVPDVVFYNALNTKVQIQNKAIRNSQTKYSVSADHGKVVVLDQSFSMNWELFGSEITTKFIANGYSNGWIVEEDKSDIIIKYSLQDLVKLGFIITGVSFMICLLFIVAQFRKK